MRNTNLYSNASKDIFLWSNQKNRNNTTINKGFSKHWVSCQIEDIGSFFFNILIQKHEYKISKVVFILIILLFSKSCI